MSLSRKNSSYIKDATDFLNKVSKIHNSPETKKKKLTSVSMNVQTLYPNIPYMSYANIFMSVFESNMLLEYQNKYK